MPTTDALSQAIERAVGSVSFLLLGPEILVTLAGLLALALGATLKEDRRQLAGWTCIAGNLTAMFFLVVHGARAAAAGNATAFSGLFIQDSFAVFFKFLFLATTVLVALLSLRYLEEEKSSHGEYYALLCFATLGMMFMASGRDLITIYVGLELMALSIYVLVGFLKRDRRSNEAAMKYFILGALSSAFFIYGISLFYGLTGKTSLEAVSAALGAETGNPLATLALIMISVGLAFKVAAVPFHAWAPDAYEGAPTPITAYVSVASKAAAFAILLRILLTGLYDLRDSWSLLLWVLAALSMTLGNFVACVQDNVKRMLAYSSIAHAGYTLLGVLAASAAPPAELTGAARSEWIHDMQQWAQGGTLLYLFAYMFMNVGAFGLITLLRRRNIIGDDIRDFSGLFHRSPSAAIAMGIFLLSLGGIPPTAGFAGKLILFGAAVKGGFYALAILAVLNTAVSIYFYFRIVVSMWMTEARESTPLASSPALTLAIGLSVVATLAVGILPGYWIDFAQGSILEVGKSITQFSLLR